MVQLYWTGCLPLTIHKRDPTTAEHEVFDLLAIRASAGSTFLRRPGKRDSSTLTMSMPSFVRTLDQHRTTTNRTPARKSFTQPDPRSSSGYRKTPRFPVDELTNYSTIYTEIISDCAITSNHGKPRKNSFQHRATSIEGYLLIIDAEQPACAFVRIPDCSSFFFLPQLFINCE